MNALKSALRSGAGPFVGAIILALVPAGRSSAADASSDAFPNPDSYIKISGQVPWISGNGAAAQARLKSSTDAAGGIEDLHIEKDLSRTDEMTVDGKALFGTADYLAHVNYLRADVGSVDVGYKQFRTFYDGIGGFFPVTNLWAPLNPENLHIDRGSFWAELKMNLKDQPAVYSLKYTNESRHGQKDSLTWGDSDNSGQPKNTLNGGLGINSSATIRKLTPSPRTINERVETVAGSVKINSGSTSGELRLFREETKKRDNQYVVRFPGETTPVTSSFTAITVANGTDASQWPTFGNQTIQSTDNNENTRTFGVTGTLMTALSPKVTMRSGLSFQDIKGSSSGDRLIITNTPTGPAFVGGLAVTPTYNVKDLVGRTKGKINTATVSLEYRPSDKLTGTLGLKAQDKNEDSNGAYNVTATPNANLDLGGGVKPAAGTTVPVLTRRLEVSTTTDRSLAPSLDVRYKGFKTVALYATVNQMDSWGTDDSTPPYNQDLDPRVASGSTPANPFNQIIAPKQYFLDIKEQRTDYVLGADWHKYSRLTVRTEVYLKDHHYHETGYNTNAATAGILPAPGPDLNSNYDMAFKRYGGKITVTLKLSDTIASTTRYIIGGARIDLTGFLPTLPWHNSMGSRSHTISETVDWNPSAQLYFQVDSSVVFNYITTGYPTAGSVAASGVIPFDSIVQVSNNNYVTTNLLVGAVVTKSDDLQFQVSTYNVTDGSGNFARALYTEPYGASGHEFSATVGLKHKINERLTVNAKVGYMDNKNDLNGGRTDFHGPLGYIAFTQAL